MDAIRVIVNGAGGRMGRMIVSTVSRQDDMVVVGAVEASGYARIGEDAGALAGIGDIGVPIAGDLLAVIASGDVIIEFTSPEATLQHLEVAGSHGKAAVVATTGFDAAQESELDRLASLLPCVVAANYSVGVNVLLKAVEITAKTLGDAYDVEIIEAHHNEKKDAPSGTAIRIAEVAAKALDRDLGETAVYGRHGVVGARTPKEIGIHAIRGGDIVGDHTIMFVGQGERVELTHRAQSRETFANGAVRAARWVLHAPLGRHSIEDVLFSRR